MAHLRLRRDEIGRAGGVEDVFVRAVAAFLVIAVQKRLGRQAVQHEAQFPAEVVDVLNAGIGAPRAEGRYLMRGVAGEDHAAMAESLHPPALEGVDRRPDEVVFDIRAEHRIEAAADVFFPELFLAVDIPAELKIDAPDAVRLLVQQRAVAGFEMRFEPEPAFRREIRFHRDVGDQEVVLENAPLEIEAHHRAQRRGRAIAADQPIGFDTVGSVRR